jgi:hypothetical protein
MSEVVSKVGIHCIGDKRDGYGPFLQTIAAAGRRLSVVKCRDNFGAMDEPLALWPDVLTIGAMTEWDDAGYNVIEAYNRILMASIQNPKVKYWEYLNERNGDWQQQADLYIALLPMLRSVGLRLCMFNCATGTPQYPDIDDTGYREIKRACKFAKDGGYDALLGLHEYESGGGTIGRYQVLAEYLEDYRALIPIAVTEYGFETYPGYLQHMGMLTSNDPLYMADPRVVGCADWTLGGGGWAGSNYQADLPAMADYIANVAPVVVPPPDPDPDPIRTYERVAWLVPPSVVYGDAKYNTIALAAKQSRGTVTASADDAFAVVPNCTKRTVVVYNVSEYGGIVALEDWVRTYYAPVPAITYRTV